MYKIKSLLNILYCYKLFGNLSYLSENKTAPIPLIPIEFFGVFFTGSTTKLFGRDWWKVNCLFPFEVRKFLYRICITVYDSKQDNKMPICL